MSVAEVESRNNHFDILEPESPLLSSKPCSKCTKSENFHVRQKPIRKAKFMSRKEIMFRYMEKVERINNKLLEQKRRHKVKQQAKIAKRKSNLNNFFMFYQNFLK